MISGESLFNDGVSVVLFSLILAISQSGAKLEACQRELIAEASSLCARIGEYSRTLESNEIIQGELQHRIRNLYSTIGAMATLTQRNYPDPSRFRQVLSDRLVMMQRAQNLAITSYETDLASLIAEILAPYSEDYTITIGGPPVTLAGEAAAAIALVTHELSTNSAKYGAFSKIGGQLNVSWSISPAQDGTGEYCFNLGWLESNGPIVVEPSRKGYGTVMINGSIRNAFGGMVSMHYDLNGFLCQITSPFTSRLGRCVDV